MISLELSLKQMAWANAKLMAEMLRLPDDAWRAKSGIGEWHVAANIFHLVASTDWYTYQLGKPLIFTKEPDSIEEIRELGNIWADLDGALISECSKPDERLSFIDEGKELSAMRSTILSQAAIHAVEHRVQIALALSRNGYPFSDLEDFSLWGYIWELENK